MYLETPVLSAFQQATTIEEVKTKLFHMTGTEQHSRLIYWQISVYIVFLVFLPRTTS